MAWENYEQVAQMGGSARPGRPWAATPDVGTGNVRPGRPWATVSRPRQEEAETFDDKLLRVANMTMQETDRQKALSFSLWGEEYLRKFLERHRRDMTEGAANEFQHGYKRLLRDIGVLQETNYREGALRDTFSKIYDRLINEVVSVLQHSAPRQRAAHMSRQDVPRPRHAYDGGHTFTQRLILDKRASIKQELSKTREYGLLVNDTIDSASPSKELSQVHTQVQLAKMELELWRQSKQQDNTEIYDNEIKRVLGQLRRLVSREDQLVAAAHHTSYTRSRSAPSLRLRGGGIETGSDEESAPTLDDLQAPHSLQAAAAEAQAQQTEDVQVPPRNPPPPVQQAPQQAPPRQPPQRPPPTFPEAVLAGKGVEPPARPPPPIKEEPVDDDPAVPSVPLRKPKARPGFVGPAGSLRITRDSYLDLVTRDNPEEIKKRTGHEVKGLVDLYKQFGHGVFYDRAATFAAIMKYLEFDANLGPRDPIPEDVLLTFTKDNRRIFPRGTTLGEFINKTIHPYSRRFDINWNDPNAENRKNYGYAAGLLIQEGTVYNYKGPPRNEGERVKRVLQTLPKGPMIDLFRKMRYWMNNKVTVQQLFQYKKADPGRVPPEMTQRLEQTYAKRAGIVGVYHGRDRQKMALLSPFFDETLMGPSFWSKSLDAQTRFMRKRSGPTGNINHWRKVLTEFFGVHPDTLPKRQRSNGTYSHEEAKQTWAALSSELQALQKHSGMETFKDAMIALQYHSSGLSPSPESDPRRRQVEDLTKPDEEETEEAAQPRQSQRLRGRKQLSQAAIFQTFQGPSLYFDYFRPVSQEIDFTDTSKPPGYSLLEGFEKVWDYWAAGNHKTGFKDKDIGTFENFTMNKLLTAINHVKKKKGSVFFFPREASGQQNTDKEAQKEILLKMGWNYYMSRRKGTTPKDVLPRVP